MLTKMKLAIIATAALVGGAASATLALADSGGTQNPDFAAKRAQRHQMMLQKYDANGDGKLDQTERAAMRHDRMVDSFKKLDTNGDGQISFAEFENGAKLGRGMHGRMHHGMKHRQQPQQQAPASADDGGTDNL